MTLANRVEIPESKDLAPDVGKVISTVCDHFKVTPKKLLTSRIGTENIARDIAIYLVRLICCQTLPNVGREFGINNYSTVSSVVQRVNKRIEKDKTLIKELQVIETKAHKGQKLT